MLHILCAAALLFGFASTAAGDDASLTLELRYRQQTSPESGRWHALTRTEQWAASETAIIVCDMWDKHGCLNAARRGAEMAPRMNEVLRTARDRGVTIIHAPSSCMDAYKDHPARRRVLEIPRSERLPEGIGQWCYRIPAEEEGEYPIDQSDGACDDDPAEHEAWAKQLATMGRDPRRPWKRQTELLEIRDEDCISDSGEEIWSLLEARGIENVVLVGVHTNMCVLGRPFGLRQMAKNGKNVVLMRDMTDTMYNPERRPYVSHFSGTDLVVEHIEKYVCPTILSTAFLGGEPFRFSGDRRKKLVIVTAEDEYKTEETLPVLARKYLGHDFQVEFVFADDEDRNRLPGIDKLNDADIALFSIRRRVLPKEQMEIVRRYFDTGRPLVAFRTSSHAFSLRNAEPPDGYADWPEFDRDILGGNYTGHHGSGPATQIEIAQGAGGHPILEGIDIVELVGRGSLYKASPLADSASPLLIGSIPDKQPEPVAWTNVAKTGSRVFYTSLGHVGDFEQPEFNRLLRNALYWAAGLEVPAGEASESSKVPLVPVRGEVRLNGKPLPGATVSFVSRSKSRVATGTTDASGTFVLTTRDEGEGAVIGEHVVTIATNDRDELPPQYSDREKSALRAEVQSGENVFDFEIRR